MTAAEYIRTIPQRVNPETLQDKESCFHLLIAGEEGGEFTIIIKDGQCTEQDGLHGSPKCTCRTTASIFMEIVTGKKNPQMALLKNELKIDNLGELMKFAKSFGMV
jgi:putative sterol carrier protein